MSFPYPQNPEDWQTAYTRDMAHADSTRLAFRTILWLGLCIVFALVYAMVWARRCIQLADGMTLTQLVFKILAVLAVVVVIPLTLTAAFRTACAFFSTFYRPDAFVDPGSVLLYRLFGRPKLPAPLNIMAQFQYVLINDGEVLKKDGWPAWAARHMGGPTMMIVFDGYAAYLERGNRFSRVVGPGKKTPFLEWYETIKYVVDLRPQVKTGETGGWTKDGIHIKIQARVECRIGDPNNPRAEGLIYPFDPVAVKKAIERYALRWPNRAKGEPPEEFTWIDAAWGQVTGVVPGYIGSRFLDDLFIATHNGGQILSPDALRDIFDRLNRNTQVFGVYVTDFQILKIEFPDEVNSHQKDNWKAERQSIATILMGDSKANSIRVLEKVRADAQRHLIRTIISGLDKNEDGKFTEPLLLSLPGLLDKDLKDPLLRAYLSPQKYEDALDKLKEKDKPAAADDQGSDTEAHHVKPEVKSAPDDKADKKGNVEGGPENT